MNEFLAKLDKKEGLFVSLRILDQKQQILSENIYWLAGKDGEYSGLKNIKQAPLKVEALDQKNGKVAVTLSNAAGNPVAFFNRVALINSNSNERILPAFYDDNYVSILPGESKTVMVEYTGKQSNLAVEVYGWNVAKQKVEVN